MISRRLFSLAGLAVPAAAQTDIKFTLDWKFEGPVAGFFLAVDNGHFEAEGLNGLDRECA